MTPRERFVAALERRPLTGRVPHFELVFFLTMEAFGKVHPSHRSYGQWDQMEEKERRLHIADMADLYIATADRYEHSAIFLHPNPGDLESVVRLIDAIRERSGDRYFLMMHGDATFGIPSGRGMQEFSYRMVDDPDGLKAQAADMVDGQLAHLERLRAHGGLDGLALCADYCLNTGPFLSPSQFSEFVTPYLARLIQGQRDMGFYVIKHTDGNIMPILDDLLDLGITGLQGFEEEHGVGYAEMVKLKDPHGRPMIIIGCVSVTSTLPHGTVDDVRAAVERSFTLAGKGRGFVLSPTSSILPETPLENIDALFQHGYEFGRRFLGG